MPARMSKKKGSKSEEGVNRWEGWGARWSEGTTVQILQLLALLGLAYFGMSFYLEQRALYPVLYVGDDVRLITELTTDGAEPTTFIVGTPGKVSSLAHDFIPTFANVILDGAEYSIPLSHLERADSRKPDPQKDLDKKAGEL